jgi:hypothetical protein
MPVRILRNSPAAYKHSFVPSGTVNLALLLAVFPLFLLALLPCKVLRPNMSEFLLQAEHCSHCPPHRLRLTIHYLSPKSCRTCRTLPSFFLQTYFPLAFLSLSELLPIPNLLRYSRASHGPAMWVILLVGLFNRGARCHICLPRTKFLTWALSGLVPLAL